MKGSRIILGAISAAVCGFGSLWMLYRHPKGHLAVNQSLILIVALITGFMVFWLRQERPDHRQARSGWVIIPVLVLSGWCVVFSAQEATNPLVQQFAEEVELELSHACESEIQHWPEAPTAADYRALEWSLHEAKASLIRIQERSGELGLEQPRELRFTEQAIQERGFTLVALSALHPGILAASRPQQYQQMGLRIQNASEELSQEAERTGLPCLIGWAKEIEDAVAGLSDFQFMGD